MRCWCHGEDSGFAKGSPRLVCDEPEFNFGQCVEPRAIEHAFTIRNAGTERLVIGRVKTSCGCTVATLSTNVLPAGASTQLKARVSLARRRGRQSNSITVESNDPVNPRLRLLIKGTIVSELALEPSSVRFGQILPDAAERREVRLSSLKPEVGITKITCDRPGFAIETGKKEGEKCREFVVRTVPPLPRGRLHTRVRVRTDHPRLKELGLPVSAFVLSEVNVLPREIVLSEEQTNMVKRAVLLRRGTVEKYKVLRVEPPGENIKVKIRSLPGSVYRIELSNLSASTELTGKAVRIITDVKNMEEISVPIRVMRKRRKPAR